MMVKQKKLDGKRSFCELVRMLTDAEESLAVSDDEYDAIIGSVVEKVDHLREAVSVMDAEIERLKKLKQEFALAQEQVEKSKDRLLDYILYAMKQNGHTFLQGEKFKLQLGKRTTVRVSNDKPTDDQYIALSAKYPGIIKKELSWNKLELSKLVETENPEELKEVCYYGTTEFIKWRVRKDV